MRRRKVAASALRDAMRRRARFGSAWLLLPIPANLAVDTARTCAGVRTPPVRLRGDRPRCAGPPDSNPARIARSLHRARSADGDRPLRVFAWQRDTRAGLVPPGRVRAGDPLRIELVGAKHEAQTLTPRSASPGCAFASNPAGRSGAARRRSRVTVPCRRPPQGSAIAPVATAGASAAWASRPLGMRARSTR